MNNLISKDNLHVLNSKGKNHVLIINELTPELKNKIDKKLVSLYKGPLYRGLFNVASIKSEFKRYYKNKQEKNYDIGFLAEFLVHLFLLDESNNNIKLKQEFLFQNLEEYAIKKGFDGLYTDEHNEVWLMESKSTENSSSVENNHKTKLDESYRDLKNKKLKYNDQNAWRNAYNHASHSDVNAQGASILAKLDRLNTDYITNKQDLDIADFNIIPCSTFFVDKIIASHDDIHIEIENFKNNKSFKDCIVVTFTLNFAKDLVEYICGDID